MSENLKFKGRLMEKSREAVGLTLQIKGLVASLRDLLDPFEEIEDLRADMISEQAMELAARQIEYKEAKAEIKAISKALGKN
jgi:Zn-dependent metalloprotease